MNASEFYTHTCLNNLHENEKKKEDNNLNTRIDKLFTFNLFQYFNITDIVMQSLLIKLVKINIKDLRIIDEFVY